MPKNEANNPDLTPYSFPHLDDTDFPLLDNVDVYEYKNDFDYTRWTDDTKVYLCNVLWNNDYSNVVKFDSDEQRDEYFNSLDNYTVELQSAFNIAPNGTTKVPIPYQVATRYNYMYVDLPIMTSEEQPINYESTRRTKRFYYFVNELYQNSPNSTTLVVSPDNWTTYINNVDIPYLMLERGHAPMAQVEVETYLSNPIENNRYLLAPDFDFSSGADLVKSADFVPINNGDKYILFASTMSEQQIMNQPYPTPNSSANTPATFANAQARNGYQYIVNDYEWGIGGYDYNGLYTQTTSFQSSNDAIPNNMTMIACHAANAATMFAYMSEHIPFFYKTIKACFMVDDSMFSLGTEFTFCSVTCYTVVPAADSVLSAITLAKSDFAYDSKYADIAKLYTSPYARIEVTDNNGDTKSFKIENTSSLEIKQATAIAFPYISIQAYITGINGNGFSTYTWKTISNASVTKSICNDDFGEYLWDWNIPTYALYVKGYDDYKASNYPKQFVDRYNAIAEYHKTVGMDNTQYENAKDSANTTQTMTNNSANTEYNNAIAMADTINTNNIASANTAQANSNASSDTAETNVNNQATAAVANTATDIARATENMTYRNSNMVNSTIDTNTMLYTNANTDIGVNEALTQADNASIFANAVMNAVGGIGGGMSGYLSHLGVGNTLGAIGSAVETGTNVMTSGASSVIAATKNTTQTATVNTGIQNKTSVTRNYNTDITNLAVTEQQDIRRENNVADTKITKTTTDMWNTNADNTNNTEHANAARTNSTSIANANRTESTSNANALRTRNNTTTNAQLNRNTTVANAGYTRENAVDNAKITLEQKRIANQQSYNSARLTAPVQYGTDSGDPTLDAYERRGLQVKVRTQSDGNIAQAGDLMLRYGYALNQVWNVPDSGLCVMKHFTYWKASDIWINEGEGVNQDAQSDIQQAFENGVTIWSNPNEIGKVSIYDNWN